MQEEILIEKIRRLPVHKQSAVEDFVDFLAQREEYQLLTEVAIKMSEKAFQEVWDNPADAAYDKL